MTYNATTGVLQVFSSTSVGEGAGVYWMFYSGGNYENGSVPSSLPGAAAACEGARHALASLNAPASTFKVNASWTCARHAGSHVAMFNELSATAWPGCAASKGTVQSTFLAQAWPRAEALAGTT